MGGPDTRSLSMRGGGGVNPNAPAGGGGPGRFSAVRNVGPRSPLMPSKAALQRIASQGEAPIRSWLNRNVNSVRTLSLNAATAEVMRGSPAAMKQGSVFVSSVIRRWAVQRKIRLPRLSVVPHPADIAGPDAVVTRDSAWLESLKSAMEEAVGKLKDGLKVERKHGVGQINLSGFTVGLTQHVPIAGKQSTLKGQVKWSGETSVTSETKEGKTTKSIGATVIPKPEGTPKGAKPEWRVDYSHSHGPAHFKMSVGSHRWSVSLSFRSGEHPADLSLFQKVFTDATVAVRQSAREIGAFSPDKTSEFIDKMKPQLDPVKKAVDKIKRTAGTPSGVSFGIKASGPMSGRAASIGSPTEPKGVAVQGVLTISF